MLGCAVRGEKEKQIRDLESVVLVSFLKGSSRVSMSTCIICRGSPSHLPQPCPSPRDVSGPSSASPFPAQMACQKRPSGHLASVLSGAEASFMSSLIKNNLNALSDVWIGLHDPTEVRLHLLLSVTSQDVQCLSPVSD